MESDLEYQVAERTRRLEQEIDALRKRQGALAKELDTSQRLQHVAIDLIGARGTRTLYEQILDTAMAILEADFAAIQKYHPERGTSGELSLLSHRGFHGDALKHWEWVGPTACTSCAQAMRTGARVAVADVRTCDFMAGSGDLQGYLQAGVLSILTTPLISRSGALLGMLSTHWREPHEMSPGEIQAMDVLARLAASLIERARVEDAVSESEARFRNLADSAPVMIWVADPDQKGTFFNKCCLDFTGRTMDDKLGDGWVSGLHPDDRDAFLEVYVSSIRARREFRRVFRLQRGDGAYRWVLCTGVPNFLPGGTFAGFIGSVIEINDQKLIEEGLRASEIRLLAAQRLAKVGSWERQLNGEATHWSKEMLRILGVQDSSPANLAEFLTYVHTRDRGRILEVAASAVASTAPVDTEYRIVRPDGDVRLVRSIVEAIRDDRGVPLRITEAVQDITERVQAREKLAESEQYLKNAERLAHVGHWQWDIRANRVSGSEEMYRIFAKPPGYVPTYGGFLSDLSALDKQRMERLIADSLERKVGNSLEYQIVLPQGDLRTIACIWEVLLDEEGTPVRLFGTCQDITESRRTQEASFARQKLESVGTLASGIAHDFNNLLGGVLIQADLGLAECDAGQYPHQELVGIRNVAIRGSEIVRQLMIYAGRESAEGGVVDVSRIVEEMLELLKVSVSKRAVLEADLGKLPPIRANAAQVRQIVMNLVTNASDAIGDRDGVIRVATRWVKAGRNPADNSFTDEDHLELEVSDTGRGMSIETQTKMFDPFFTTKSAGHGLGLSVVHGIVRGIGGTILFNSEPDKGTTFQILLPAAKRPEGAAIDPRASEEATSNSFREATILVVEDEDLLREAIAKMLRKAGFESYEAADGSAAIELLRARGASIDLILLDLTIPGASGQEVVTQAVKMRPDVRVVLTSAYGREMIAASMKSPPVRDFIRKPFRIEDLVSTLRKTLSATA